MAKFLLTYDVANSLGAASRKPYYQHLGGYEVYDVDVGRFTG
jgi:hypothetical protein